MSRDKYVSPLSERYASKEMQYIFSPDMKTSKYLYIFLICSSIIHLMRHIRHEYLLLVDQLAIFL